MKAIIETSKSNARNLGSEKETVSTYKVIGRFPKGKLQVICEARMYMSRSNNASVVYCSLWVHGEKYTSGHGKAGGYGYHKESQALQNAINSAGIKLYGKAYITQGEKVNYKKECDIGGVGSSAMQDALLAIAKAAGARGELLVV